MLIKTSLIIKTIILFIIGPGLALVYLPHLIIKYSGVSFGAQNWFSYLAIIFWLSGIYLVYKSLMNFIFIGSGTPAPFDPPKNLVTINVYQFNRNPMYTGALAFMLGTFIWTQIIWLLFYLAIFWIFFHCGVVFYEEPKLKQKFGQPYLDYLQKVPRWLPKLKK